MKKNKNVNTLMIVLGFIAFASGIWSNYRQLWLQEIGYSITGISKILSVALICSSIISFIISIFSSKIKVKSIVIMSLIFRCLSLAVLLIVRNDFIIKSCVLLNIMCSVIFSISFYPLLSFESRRNSAYRRKMLIEYFAKDIGIVLCGLLLGVSIGNYIFNYDTCLLISLVATFISCLFLFTYKSSEDEYRKNISLKKSVKSIFSEKVNRVFLFNQLVCYIAYGMIFDLMMLILTNYISFDASFAAVFIIGCNMLGTIFSFIFSKFSKEYSVALSAFIKYGTRGIIYYFAFFSHNPVVFIFTIIYAHITSRVLEDKATGCFLTLIDEENQFLFGNMRYFELTLGEGIGAYLAGVLLSHSLNSLFLGAAIITTVQTLIYFYLSKLREEKLAISKKI